MRAYKGETTESFDATMFASTYEEAAGMFCTHHEIMMGRMPGEFAVEIMRRPKAGMKRNYLDRAIERGVCGVGYYMAGRGWAVVPADLIVGFMPQ